MKSPRSASQSISVLHLTDPHLFADAEGVLRGGDTLSTFTAVLRHARDSDAWPPDLIALTGDLAQDESVGAYERIRTALADLGVPILCIPGNHDDPELMAELLNAAPFHYCQPVQKADWLVVGVSSFVPNEAHGWVATQELDRVDQEIADSDAQHVLVCVHHPPLAVGSRWLDGVGLRNSEEFLSRMTQLKKVRGTVSGHIHQVLDDETAGIRVIGTPATCRQFAPASETFAVDDSPPAYAWLSLHSDGSIDNQLVRLNAQ